FVRMGDMPTLNALELRLRAAIFFSDMPTFKATTAGVARVNQFDSYPVHFGFVGEKGSELVKRPVAMLGAFFTTTNPSPRTNALQILKAYRSLRVFGLQNHSLGNTVIHVALKATLFTRKFFEVT